MSKHVDQAIDDRQGFGQTLKRVRYMPSLLDLEQAEAVNLK